VVGHHVTAAMPMSDYQNSTPLIQDLATEKIKVLRFYLQMRSGNLRLLFHIKALSNPKFSWSAGNSTNPRDSTDIKTVIKIFIFSKTVVK
jgi:hypothetical protein